MSVVVHWQNKDALAERFAVVRGTKDADTIAKYLPANYEVFAVDGEGVHLRGRDYCGWTLEDYVIPRLASGLYFCEEVIA